MKLSLITVIISTSINLGMYAQENQSDFYTSEAPNFLNLGTDKIENYANIMAEILVKEKIANNLHPSNSIFQKKIFYNNGFLMVQIKKEVLTTNCSHIQFTMDIKWKEEQSNLIQNSNTIFTTYPSN